MAFSPNEASGDGRTDIWYKDGLRFECQRCSMCCRISGMVWVDSGEIRRISEYLGVSESIFKSAYIREVDGKTTLAERADGSCMLLNPRTGCCKAYRVRPEQCSSFPFWPELLRNQVAWARESTLCPGMDKGRLWDEKEIKKKMMRD